MYICAHVCTHTYMSRNKDSVLVADGCDDVLCSCSSSLLAWSTPTGWWGKVLSELHWISTERFVTHTWLFCLCVLPSGLTPSVSVSTLFFSLSSLSLFLTLSLLPCLQMYLLISAPYCMYLVWGAGLSLVASTGTKSWTKERVLEDPVR